MKRHVSICILCALLLCLLPAPAPVRGEGEQVRVLLSTQNKTELSLELKGIYRCEDTLLEGGSLDVSLKNGKITLTHSVLGTVYEGEGPASLRQDGTEKGYVLLATAKSKVRKYTGEITFYDRNGVLGTVNTVTMEDYICGVAVPEVGRDAPEALLKAALLTAKGFALAELQPKQAYDVGDTTLDQLYYGYFPDAVKVMEAAAQTGTAVLVKHNMYDGFKGGIEIPESIEIAREIERWKVNGIVLSGGFVSKAPMAVMRGLIPIYTMSYYSPLWLRAFIRYCGPFMIRQFPFSECYFLEDAKKFREALQLPLIYVGGLVSREGIERALDSGFELVQMARALVNDPAFVNKLREGDAATRSECDHRNYCIARMYSVDMKCCKHCGDLPRKIREELAKLP